MANVSSSNGLEKRPKLRFPGFDDPWKVFKAEELFQNITDRNHPDETVLTIIQGKGTLPREQAGRNIHYDDASLSNYKKVEQGDFIIHLRSFEGGLEMANEAGIVSPAYTILRCKRPHSSLFYDAYFHTDEFINHNLSKSVEGIRDGRQISYEAFKWLGIPYCEPTEQEKISTLFSAFNERIAKQRDLVESLKKYKRGLSKAVFSTNSELFPKSTVASLGELFPFIRNGFVGTVTPFFTSQENGVRYLQGTNIHDGKISDETAFYVTQAFNQKHSKNILKSNDILVVQSGHVGECAVVGDNYAGSNCHALIIMSNGGECASDYICQYINSDDGKKKIAAITTGNTIKHILATSIANIEVPLPSKKDQQRIAELLNSWDNRIEQEIRNLCKLVRIKEGLLQQLFI
ncbi:restriction endonuclease subunit S [Waltera acetigignens]|jgi:type I restriction enzyme S subunit